MVVYLRRAGDSSSTAPISPRRSESVSPTLGDLLSYVADHPAADLWVAALAERANMSERSFHRLFKRRVGVTPIEYRRRFAS